MIKNKVFFCSLCDFLFVNIFIIGDEKGTDANAHYLPSFAEDLIRLAKLFPLWSAVMTPFFKCEIQRGSRAASEGHFNELKNQILHGASLMSVHKLFITYWRANKGSTMLASSKLTDIKLQNNEIIQENDEINDRESKGMDIENSIEEDHCYVATNLEKDFKQQQKRRI